MSLLVWLSLLFLSPVQAHQLESDGTIGAVLHVEPNDSPRAGEAAKFHFDFRDTAGRFRAAACQCLAIVTAQGKEVATSTILPAGEISGSFQVVLPESGAYTVQVIGTPVDSTSFQPFSLRYVVRAEGSAQNQAAILIGLATVVVAVVAIAVHEVRRQRYSQKKETA
jgi:hypothetical protein